MSATVPTALAAAMAERGLSAAELARRSGLAASSISNWLHGRVIPHPESLRTLEQALETPMVTTAAAVRARCSLQTCRRQYVRGHPSQRYCRRSCTDRASDLRRGDRRQRRLGSDLVAIVAGVGRMCHECVGASLVCVQGDCPLRTWSPYPLATKAPPRRSRGGA